MKGKISSIISIFGHIDIGLIKHDYFVISSRERYKRLIELMNGNYRYDTSKIRNKYLAKQLKIAYKYVPFWKQFNQLGKINYKNAETIIKTLPITSKQDLREKSILFRKEGSDESNTSCGRTGATTGVPLIFLTGHVDEYVHQCAFYKMITGQDFEKELQEYGRIVSFDGTRPFEDDIKKNIFWKNVDEGVYGTVSFCSFYLDDESYIYYIAKLNELRPVVIRGYSNAILQMAKYINISHKLSFAPKAIYVTSEVCTKESMDFISKSFDCPVYGQYGQSEACCFAWSQCNDTTYYCSPFYGYVEILNKNNERCEVGEIGEVIVTSFGNWNQPFIRYRTGDLVEFGGEKNGIVMISDINGRVDDYILDKNLNHIPLVGYLGIHYLKCAKDIISYQIVQHTPGKVIFKVVSTKWNKECENEVIEMFSIKNIDVDFELVDEIPLTKRGKRKLVVRNIENCLED